MESIEAPAQLPVAEPEQMTIAEPTSSSAPKVLPSAVVKAIVDLDSTTKKRDMNRVHHIVDGIITNPLMPSNIRRDDLVTAVQWYRPFVEGGSAQISAGRFVTAFQQHGLTDHLGNEITGTKGKMAQKFISLRDMYVLSTPNYQPRLFD